MKEFTFIIISVLSINLYAQELIVHNKGFIYYDSDQEYLEKDILIEDIDEKAILTTEEYFYNKMLIELKNTSNSKLYFLINPHLTIEKPYHNQKTNRDLSEFMVIDLEGFIRPNLNIYDTNNLIDTSEICLAYHNYLHNTDVFSRRKHNFELSDFYSLTENQKNSFLSKYELILQPKETKYHTIYFSLPEYNYDEFNSIIHCNYINRKDNNKIEISLKQNKEFIKKLLTKEKKKELKSNNIKIFHGTLKSNKVPLIVKEE